LTCRVNGTILTEYVYCTIGGFLCFQFRGFLSLLPPLHRPPPVSAATAEAGNGPTSGSGSCWAASGRRCSGDQWRESQMWFQAVHRHCLRLVTHRQLEELAAAGQDSVGPAVQRRQGWNKASSADIHVPRSHEGSRRRGRHSGIGEGSSRRRRRQRPQPVQNGRHWRLG